MKFYGTSAAEGIPNPFCRCFLCENAREKGGKEIRKRSMFRLNEKIAIDLGADAFTQAISFGDFVDLEHVLVTHTHEDHFDFMMMAVRKMATERPDKPLTYYLTDKAFDIVDFYKTSQPILKGGLSEMESNHVIAFQRLEFYQEYEIGDVKVIPLKGNHFGNMDEHSANYLIKTKNGKVLFYGLDTGYYLEETFQALKEFRIDYFISECTFGNAPDRPLKPHGHLDIPSFLLVAGKLLAQGTIHGDTQIYLTHINHCHTATHEVMTEYFATLPFSCCITPAYDGMLIGE